MHTRTKKITESYWSICITLRQFDLQNISVKTFTRNFTKMLKNEAQCKLQSRTVECPDTLKECR